MTTQRPLERLLLLLATAILAVAGCSSVGQGRDKAGGAGQPVVLRMANASGDLGIHPAVGYFAERVDEISGGSIRIEVEHRWGDFAPDAEQQVVRGVSTGAVDLGWAGSRVFDTMGIESFRALTAPMLIDSYAIQHAVIESGMTEQMLNELEGLGVIGLGVLPDGLRKPIGVARPLLGPPDWQGITFGTLTSNGQAEAIRALGATPVAITGIYRDEAAAAGTIQGFELSLTLYNPTLRHLAPYVTTNVTLWPLVDVLFANPQRLETLTADQRRWLQQAADDAAGRAGTFGAIDAHVIEDACATGVHFADASDSDLAALRDAFAPVYAQLERDPSTRAFIEQIRTLKGSTRAEPPPVIPEGCSGEASKPASHDAGTSDAGLNGTYRYVITMDEANDAGMIDPEDTYPQVITVRLLDGRFSMNGGDLTGSYTVADDRITFDVPEFGYGLRFTISIGPRGDLHLTPVQPMDPGDAFVFSSQRWTKVR